MAGVLTKIYETEKVNFERMGNLRFAVTYKPSSDPSDKAFAKDRAKQMADAWSKAIRENKDGRVSDFVAVGDVDIKVIGADAKTLDCEIPARQMTEQIVRDWEFRPLCWGFRGAPPNGCPRSSRIC